MYPVFWIPIWKDDIAFVYLCKNLYLNNNYKNDIRSSKSRNILKFRIFNGFSIEINGIKKTNKHFFLNLI